MTETAEVVVARIVAAPRALPTTRLVCVDGLAGAGKTTLAHAVAGLLTEQGLTVSVVTCDDVLEGWTGLPSLGERLDEFVVRPLALGRPAGFHPWDWLHLRRRDTWVEVPAADVVILEGVGSAHPRYAAHTALSVFVEAPRDVRLARGLERDGSTMEQRWLAWLDDEADLHIRLDTRARADVVVDGVTGRVSR